MAEDVVYTRTYNSGQEGWWNSSNIIIPRTSCFNGSAVVSCSAEFTDTGCGFNWADLAADVSQSQSSSDESPSSVVSNSSLLTLQGTHHAASTAPMTTDLAVPSPALDWNRPLLSSAREESAGYHTSALRGDDLQLLNPNQKNNNMCSDHENISTDLLLHHNINNIQGLPQYQHHYESLLRSLLLEPEIEPYNYTQPRALNEVSPDPKQQQQLQPLQFSTNINTPSANRWATSPINEAISSGLRLSSPGNNAVSRAPQENLNRSNRATNSVSEGVGSRLSANTAAHQPAFKKPRIETPSPLPTFKVRKEKMGDRITALQQVVSPFGKTDTASVLTEAIDYIKFLHDKVDVLSAPYLKNGNRMHHLKSLEKSNGTEGPKRDLGSRGLCLMPVSSTFAVASDIPFDFWAPTFGGISFN